MEPMNVKEKNYLVALTNKYEDKWTILSSREETYKYLKSYMLAEDDIESFNNCFVLVEDATLNERVGIIDFMKYCQEKYFPDDDLSIDELFETDRDISADEMFNNPNRLNMSDLLNNKYIYDKNEED